MTCDACSFEWVDATDRDARNEGWSVRVLRGGRRFMMCPECESHFALVWLLREHGGVL